MFAKHPPRPFEDFTMKIFSVLLLAIVMDGCAKPTTPIKPNGGNFASVATAKPADVEPEPFRSLRAYASAHHIDWNIYCDGNAEGEAYIFWAIPAGGSNTPYIEDGGMDWWSDDRSFPTQEKAAKVLLKLIQGPPNVHPRHKPAEVKIKKKLCRTPVSGGLTDRFYQDCKECSGDK